MDEGFFVVAGKENLRKRKRLQKPTEVLAPAVIKVWWGGGHAVTYSMLDYIAPSFIVADLQVSVNYYTEKLGFFVRYMGPEGDPFWAIVGRDEISVFLKAIAPEIRPIPNHTRHEWARWDAYISAAAPDELFAEYEKRGATFHKGLDEEGGLRGFEVRDADGYVLYFGRPWP